MESKIDFTTLPHKNKTYGGANGGKLCVVYEGEDYMVKFPSKAQLNKDMSYANSCFSEYIGCHIFEALGIKAQKTLVGVYNVKGVEKVVVACKDLEQDGRKLQDFASLKNTIIDSIHNGYGTELESIIEAIDEQKTGIDSKELKEKFWDIFIVDALIGNWDRHNGNWGFLYNPINDSVKIAPIYDCGSSLYPQADEEIMKKCIENAGDRNHRVYNIPISALKLNNKKINYYDFLSSLENKDCCEALIRFEEIYDSSKIEQIIENVPLASDLQKQFYLTMINARKELILDYSYEKLMQKDRKHVPEFLINKAMARQTMSNDSVQEDNENTPENCELEY